MSQAQRVAALEVSNKKRAEHPSPAAVIVCLAAEPDVVTLAEAGAWAKLPMRERRQLAPWGIRLFECDPALPDTDPHPWRGEGGAL